MKKFKIIKSVLSFIAIGHKTTQSETDSPKDDSSPDSLAIKKMLDPNNVNLPEPNFEEFEKVNDFTTVKERKSIYNNQMSLLSSDSSEALLRKETLNQIESFQKKNIDSTSPINNTISNINEFKIKILPIPETNNPSNLAVNSNAVSGSGSLSRSRSNAINLSGGQTPKVGLILEKGQGKSSISKMLMMGSPKKSSQKSSLKSFMGSEEKEDGEAEKDNNDNDKESNSNDEEESVESLSQEDESDSDGIDVIEEEDEGEEDESPNNKDTDNNNMNIASELMTNRDNMTAQGEINLDNKKDSPSSMVPEPNDEIEEVDTLEDELSPNLDMNLLIDIYEDNQNFSTSQKLRRKKQYKNNQWLLYPDDHLKNIWNITLSLVLVYTCLVTPYRVAFLGTEDDTETWVIIDWSTDSVFWFDMIVTLVSAYYDNNDNLIVDRRQIICNYLSSWFLPDLIGVLPFDYIFSVSSYGNLVRVAKLPRLYKLVRMTKMIKVLKLIKERNTVIKYLMDILSIGPGFERLFVSLCSIFFFCHLACCFWYMAADMNDSPVNWVAYYNLEDYNNFDLYIASFYWITQTVVTVGYGDITAVNTIERSLACVYMFVGVFFYSFTIGSLSSLLSSMDSKNATFDQKLNTLIQIRNQYNIDNLLYNRVKRALKYGATQKDDEKITFLNELPLNLRIELSVIMHRNLVQGVEFFKNKPATFIALIGPYLKPFHIGKDEYIFQEGEYADEMYFIKEGDVSIVLKEFNNFEFMTITKGYHFGEVDLLFGDTRKYSYMASTDVELLALSKKDFTKIFFTEFRDIGCEIFTNANKRRIRTTKHQKEAVEFCQKQAEKKKSYSKSSIYGFKPQLSMAKKSHSSNRGSEFFNKYSSSNKKNNINKFLEIPQAHDQEIKESEEKAKEMEAIIEESNDPNLENELELPHEQIENVITSLDSGGGLEEQSTKAKTSDNNHSGLTKFTHLVAQSTTVKKKLGLDKLLEDNNNRFDEAKNKDLVSEGLKQMNLMENKMKNIENNMDEIFQFYKSLGIEMGKPPEKDFLPVSPNSKPAKKSTLEKEKEKEDDENKEKEQNKEEEKKKESKHFMSSSLGVKVKTLGLFKAFKPKKN